LERPSDGNRPKPRIQTLADLVFGLSLSIGSIALIASPPTSADQVNSHILAFTLSFLMLITVWLIYSTFTSILPVETSYLTFVNVILLFLVALVPYLLNSVEVVDPTLSAAQVYFIRDYASNLLAADIAGIFAALALFAHLIGLEEKKLVAPELVALFRAGRNRMLVISVVMLISILPQFWEVSFFGIEARILFWFVPLLSYWVGRAVRPESRTYSRSHSKTTQ
jgi:uncharacterized membrane protein